jgi:excisionase family DNA binding protein
MMLTVSELARLLGVPGALTYRLVHECQLPNYRIGRCVQVKKEDVGSYLESCKSWAVIVQRPLLHG